MVLSAFLQKLMFVKQFSINKGKIDILGSPYIMLDASDLLVLQNLDNKKVYEASKENALRTLTNIVEHANVYQGLKNQSLKNIANLSKKVGKGDMGIIRTLQQMFNVYGLGQLTIVDLNNEQQRALVKIDNSTIAQEQLKIAKSTKPSCSITAGILAGIFSYVFNKDVNCVEKNCLAASSTYCDFELS